MLVIDETSSDIAHLISRDFGAAVDATTSDAFLTWLHYQARRIPERHRSVVCSDRVKSLKLSYPAIAEIELALRHGRSLEPWLSGSIRRKKSDHRADLMFNDWQISHFHLGRIFSSAVSISRSEQLLFAFVQGDSAVLLDVQPHGSWTQMGLLRTLLETSPEAIERYEARGISSLGTNHTDTERLRLRRAGINVLVELDGRVFMPPGQGVMTSAHSHRIMSFHMHFRNHLKGLIHGIETNRAEYVSALVLRGLGPVRLGLRLVAGQLVLFDKNRRVDLLEMRPLE
jgi:hypothetical protein